MNPALYFIFFFFLVANVIALPGVRETYCYPHEDCYRMCTCSYEACKNKVNLLQFVYPTGYFNCDKTYECGTC